MDSNFKQKWEEYRSEFENVLADYLERMQIRPPVLNDSFRYSLALGGKRFRPVLMFACARSLGGKPGDVAGFALALEMLHTYSLIHDDLPAMDNDDFRRGKPSNHKVFGEGQAILAGDALLNEAYSVCFEECRKGKTYLNAAAEICKNAGVGGMIAGIPAVAEWIGTLNTKLGQSWSFLETIHLATIIYYVVLFFVVQIVRIIIVKCVAGVFEVDVLPERMYPRVRAAGACHRDGRAQQPVQRLLQRLLHARRVDLALPARVIRAVVLQDQADAPRLTARHAQTPPARRSAR